MCCPKPQGEKGVDMKRSHWRAAVLSVAATMLLLSACISLPLTLPTISSTDEPTQTASEPTLAQQPTFESPPQDSVLDWSDELSVNYCLPANTGRFSSLVFNSGMIYTVQSTDTQSVWRFLPGEAEGEKIAGSLAEDGKFIEDLRANDDWLVMLVFDHPMHVQGWRVETLNLQTNDQRRLTDNIEVNENVVYLDMELQGDTLYFLTQTEDEGQDIPLSSIYAFNLAESTQRLLLSSDSDLLYNQLAVSEKYLMISQSVSGKSATTVFPILFYNLENGDFEEIMEVSGSHPLMSQTLAAWSEQGPNQFPETIKIFDFESSLSWPIQVKSSQPSTFDLSEKYLVWVDSSEPASAFPALYLVSLDDGLTLTLKTEGQELVPQFPQVRGDQLIFGLVKDYQSSEASGMLCTIPLGDLQALSTPVQ